MLGLADSVYLTYEHYTSGTAPCSNNIFLDCGKVLQSSYSEIYGIPLALIGVVFYGLLVISTIYSMMRKGLAGKYALLILSAGGFISTLYLMYLQFFVIGALCMYCMISAGISITNFFIILFLFKSQRQKLIIAVLGFFYRNWLKKMFFAVDPEIVHNRMTHFGEILGKFSPAKAAVSFIFEHTDTMLSQKIAGIQFRNPVGLAAGFDYEAKLTQILPAVGFGFQTVGTITNKSYEGNPRPMLGRLPGSRSLMVNKGFKNKGAKAITEKLSGLSFKIPVGISIGRTNSLALKTQKQSIEDILKAFITFEKSRVNHSYYELNISCPNLFGSITFYPPANLKELLSEIDKLHLKRPVFIKMPIEKSDREVQAMLDVIIRHSPKGVIFGNLQKNRSDAALIPSEAAQFKTGYFSGKPTFKRSNELIKLSYKHYGKKLVIIGCGGVFSGEDAYAKITLGASLVQLITGMIFQGPQLISQINYELTDLLKKDGFRHISEAVGSRNT